MLYQYLLFYRSYAEKESIQKQYASLIPLSVSLCDELDTSADILTDHQKSMCGNDSTVISRVTITDDEWIEACNAETELTASSGKGRKILEEDDKIRCKPAVSTKTNTRKPISRSASVSTIDTAGLHLILSSSSPFSQETVNSVSALQASPLSSTISKMTANTDNVIQGEKEKVFNAMDGGPDTSNICTDIYIPAQHLNSPTTTLEDDESVFVDTLSAVPSDSDNVAVACAGEILKLPLRSSVPIKNTVKNSDNLFVSNHEVQDKNATTDTGANNIMLQQSEKKLCVFATSPIKQVKVNQYGIGSNSLTSDITPNRKAFAPIVSSKSPLIKPKIDRSNIVEEETIPIPLKLDDISEAYSAPITKADTVKDEIAAPQTSSAISAQPDLVLRTLDAYFTNQPLVAVSATSSTTNKHISPSAKQGTGAVSSNKKKKAKRIVLISSDDEDGSNDDGEDVDNEVDGDMELKEGDKESSSRKRKQSSKSSKPKKQFEGESEEFEVDDDELFTTVNDDDVMFLENRQGLAANPPTILVSKESILASHALNKLPINSSVQNFPNNSLNSRLISNFLKKPSDRISNETKFSNALELHRIKIIKSFKQFEGEFGEVINDLRPESDPPVKIPSCLTKLLKVHQLEAVKFLWRNCIGSVQSLKECSTKQYVHHLTGTGCILAHCMGLGKTLSVIAFLLTLFTSPIINEITTVETDSKHYFANKKFVNTEHVVKTEIKLTRRMIFRVLVVTPVNVLQVSIYHLIVSCFLFIEFM